MEFELMSLFVFIIPNNKSLIIFISELDINFN